jgi:hypothetical protein
MKAFMKWLAVALTVFAGVSGGYHFYLKSYPDRIMVVIDASFPMSRVWDRIPAVLENLEKHKYTKYALATDKGLIHSWMDELNPGRAIPYAPRNLKDLEKRLELQEIRDASEVYLVTNAEKNEISGISGWKIIMVE